MGIDGNVYALDKHLQRESENEMAYETMLDEITDAIEIDLCDIKQMFDKIVDKYGFEYKFLDYVGDTL